MSEEKPQSQKGRLDEVLRTLGRLRPTELAILVLGVIVLLVFGDLFLQGTDIASHYFGDTSHYYVYARPFAYAEIGAGNLPLWNPHLFSGTPFLGVFQTAVFYPPNVSYLFLPLAHAINLEFALHVFLMGFFTFGWVRGRGLHPFAAVASAGIVAFGATTSLRVLAGALSVVDTLTWLPLLLRCIDELSKRVRMGWVLTSVLAITMMFLAGHPPTAYVNGLVAALYCVPAILASAERLRLLGALAVSVVFAFMLAAIQLTTGFEVLSESVRRGGVSFDYATSFSFPPENMLGLLVPQLFGEPRAQTITYFGRWFYWDDVAYLGLAGLIATLAGATMGRSAGRKTALALCVLLGTMAFGRYTPVYAVLYDWIPGLDLIRAPSKFMYHSMLFASLLAGIGIDRLLRDERTIRRTAILSLALAAVLAFSAWWIQPGETHEQVSPAIRFLAELNERDHPAVGAMTRRVNLATPAIIQAAIVCGMLAALLFFARGRRGAIVLFIAVGLLDLGLFARTNRGTTDVFEHASDRMTPNVVETYHEVGTDRILEMARRTNLALHARGYGMWGYDPVVLDRYIRFIARTQARQVADLDNVTGKHPDHFHRLLSMLRIGHVVSPSGRLTEQPGALPHLLLVGRYELERDYEAILDRMNEEDFDPAELVILESEPVPAPAGGRPVGELRLLDQSTDHLTIQLEVDRAAIMLVTDSYAKGWRAEALPGSSQQQYQLLPANLVLRAVPVSAGTHQLRLVYDPISFRIGRGITLASTLLYAGAVIWWWRRGWAASPTPPTE